MKQRMHFLNACAFGYGLNGFGCGLASLRSSFLCVADWSWLLRFANNSGW
jgi:hypothetical protein